MMGIFFFFLVRKWIMLLVPHVPAIFDNSPKQLLEPLENYRSVHHLLLVFTSSFTSITPGNQILLPVWSAHQSVKINFGGSSFSPQMATMQNLLILTCNYHNVVSHTPSQVRQVRRPSSILSLWTDKFWEGFLLNVCLPFLLSYWLCVSVCVCLCVCKSLIFKWKIKLYIKNDIFV